MGTAVLAVVLQRSLIGTHGTVAMAGAYGTAFWWSAALTALAIIPCIVLVRAERSARAAQSHVEAPAGAVPAEPPLVEATAA
jgi:hypothetical protein